MKKILVMSDTHGNSDAVNVLTRDYYDYIFFLGDGLDDLGSLEYDSRLKKVRGNWDFGSRERTDLIVQVEDVMFFLTHGNEYGVKISCVRLYEKVKELKPDVVLFGHTHRIEDYVYNDQRFLNPGALSDKGCGRNTYMVINVNGKNYSVEKHIF